MAARRHRVRIDRQEYLLEVEEWEGVREAGPGRLRLLVDGEPVEAEYDLDPDAGLVSLRLAGGVHRIRLAGVPGGTQVSADGCHVKIEEPPRRGGAVDQGDPPEVTPPMPAVVVRVLVREGERVERGQALVVVSAMKMETTLTAPRTGTVVAVRAGEGDKVSPGDVLVAIEEESHGSE